MHEEGDVGGLREALSLSRIANPVNEHDADHSEDVVDTDEEVRKCGSPVVDTRNRFLILTAYGFIVFLTIVASHIVVRVLSLLKLAEALKDTA